MSAVHRHGTPGMGISLLGAIRLGLVPCARLGVSRSSVYQMTTLIDKALGEGGHRRVALVGVRATVGGKEELLAHGQNHRQWCWANQQMVARTRDVEPQVTLGRTCSTTSNRLMRARMSGGRAAYQLLS